MLNTIVEISAGFAFGTIVYPRGGVYGTLQNNYVMLLMLHSGAAEVVFDTGVHMVNEGQTALICNRGPFSICYRRGLRTHVSWCEASPATARQTKSWPGSDVIVLPTSPRLVDLQMMALSLGNATGVALNAFRESLGQAVFSAFLLDSSTNEAKRSVPPTIEMAEHILKSRFFEPWDGETLARTCGITRPHLVAGFHRCFGITPSRYLWRRRAAEGRRMLIETDQTISAIAFACGYKSQFHFSRHLAESTGLSPTQIRATRGFRPASDQAEQQADLQF